jgi:2-iminobutanoate/2-iminopropanoate deaminase
MRGTLPYAATHDSAGSERRQSTTAIEGSTTSPDAEPGVAIDLDRTAGGGRHGDLDIPQQQSRDVPHSNIWGDNARTLAVEWYSAAFSRISRGGRCDMPQVIDRRVVIAATLGLALGLVGGQLAPRPQAAAAPQSRVVTPPNYKPSPAPLSPAILVDGTLYLSGSTGADPVTGRIVAGGLEAEVRQIMSNVTTVLGAAGMTLADVVSVTVYLADMADYAAFNDLYRGYFPDGRYPARSAVAVSALARGARVELTMTAARSRQAGGGQ